jgi:hypothetical protein
VESPPGGLDQCARGTADRQMTNFTRRLHQIDVILGNYRRSSVLRARHVMLAPKVFSFL